VKNRWIIGTIVGQTVVTLVAIGYGVSAHSSWETERQRRVAGERAAVAEMATAMKGAGDRIVTVEQELERCQVRLRRTNRSQTPSAGRRASAPAAVAAPTGAPAASPGGTSLVYSAEAFRLTSGPLMWSESPAGEPLSAPPAASPPGEPRSGPGPARGGPPSCEGRYEIPHGTNFAPCPSPVR
jgi:hypothetical protein